jgi:hypothetical protein
LYSASYGKDLTNYAQGLASTQLTNYANRLQGIAGIGQASAAGVAAAGNTYAAGTTALNTSTANAQGANAYNQANIANNGINQLASAYGQYQTGQTANAWNTPIDTGTAASNVNIPGFTY